MVYEWTDKAMDEGCGVLFVSRTTGEWTIHYIVLGRSNAWDAVSGDKWGEDSPEGITPGFNASLTAGGRIVPN